MKVLAAAALVAACSYPEPIDVCVDECQILAIYPHTVSHDGQLDVHGTFEDDSVLMFPGAVMAELDGPISHRVHNLSVPFQSTAGLVTLTSRGPSHGSVPFRPASFELALNTFSSRFDQASGGRAISLMGAPQRKGAAAVAIGSYIYMIGGDRNNAPSQTIEQLVLGADGSLGELRDYPNTLQHARTSPTATVIGKYLFVTGGLLASGGADNTIERAPISDDGQLGAFEILAIELHTPRGAHAAAVIGNYLWLFGGSDGSSAIETVERAPIYNAQELGSFHVVTDLRMMPRYGHTVTVAGDRVILAGGTNGTSPQPSVEVFQIDMDGYLKDPGVRATLAVPRAHHAAVVVGMRLYLIGGKDTDSVELADLTQLSLTFQTMPDLRLGAVRGNHAAVAASNFVYVLGGGNSTGQALPVERASIMETSNVTGFSQSGRQLKQPRTFSATAVIGEYVYLFGGQNGGVALASIERTQIQPDGTLGDFVVQSTMLPGAVWGHTVTLFGGYAYLIGGANNGGPYNTVARAAIAADGSLGTFQQTGALNTERAFHATVVVGNALFVLGGMGTGGGALRSCERATFDGNGLGAFVEIPNCLVEARYGHRAAVFGDNVYVISGRSGPATLASIEVGAIDAGDNINFGSATAWLQTNRMNHTIAVAGRRLYVINGTDTGGLAMAPIEVASILPGGLISSFNVPNGNPQLGRPRTGANALVIGNYLYVFGGLANTGVDTDIIEYAEIR